MNIKAISVVALLTIISSSSWAERPQQGNSSKHQRPSFSTIDTNSNGIVEMDEFSTQHLPNGDYETIFSHIDSNSDGVISEDEFENHKPPRRNGREER